MFDYKPTHQSIHDGSPSMRVGDDAKVLGQGIYMNEDGNCWRDPDSGWVPIPPPDPALVFVDSVAITMADYDNEVISKNRALQNIDGFLADYEQATQQPDRTSPA